MLAVTVFTLLRFIAAKLLFIASPGEYVHIKVLLPLQCGQQRVHEKWRLPANEATGSAGCCQHCLPLQNTQQSRKQRGPHHYGKVSRSLFIKQLCG